MRTAFVGTTPVSLLIEMFKMKNIFLDNYFTKMIAKQLG